MLLAKIKEKLFNRRNKVEIEDVEVKGEIPASIKALIESLGSNVIKANGHYIYDEENQIWKCVEEVPEDYSGTSFYFDSYSLTFNHYLNGTFNHDADLSSDGITCYDEEGDYEVYFDINGASKINFSSLTHSFNELDPTLKQIVEDAIADGWAVGVACTQAQWSAIKPLLDKSLYLNYNGYSLIKTYTDGIDNYMFGNTTANTGAIVEFGYVSADNILFANFSEV